MGTNRFSIFWWSLRETCPNFGFFWSASSQVQTKYGDLLLDLSLSMCLSVAHVSVCCTCVCLSHMCLSVAHVSVCRTCVCLLHMCLSVAHVSVCCSFFSDTTIVKKLFYSDFWRSIQQHLWTGKSNTRRSCQEVFCKKNVCTRVSF